MKIAFVYPHLSDDGRYPLLGQNRQFRYSSSPEVRIYPLIPSTSVTLLKEAGHHAMLIDAINRRMSQASLDRELRRFDPDLVVLETKTPLMPKLWHIADRLKEQFETVAFVGDHVSALPVESLRACAVDYVVTGGDYDLSLLQLCEYLDGKSSVLPGGVWYESDARAKCSGDAPLWTNLDAVPFIDRELTNWSLYGEAYLQSPCTYILTGRGCGGTGTTPGKCSFCSWQHLLWRGTYRVRSPSNVAQEVLEIVERYRIREIFDDNESGMTWNPKWMTELESELQSRGIMGEVALSSNSRADSLTKETCGLLSRMGFRLLKIGVESGNDETLRRIGKMETVREIERGVKNAKDAGLTVLLTTMVGYPWERSEQVMNTLDFARRLLRYKAKIGDSLQASILTPYPGTPLHRMAVDQELFDIDPLDYESYDMSRPVLKSPVDPGHWCRKLWMLHYDPVFLLRCMGSIRSSNQLRLANNGFASLLGHSRDFGG